MAYVVPQAWATTSHFWKWLSMALLVYIVGSKFVARCVGWRIDDDAHAGHAAVGALTPRVLGEIDSHGETLSDVHSDGSVFSEMEHEEHEEEHSHPHEAMFFLVWAIIVGSLITSITLIKAFHGLQETVVLFVLGCIFSGIMEGLGLKEHLGGYGTSYSMWMFIDPHLLLYTMLPPLLAGDAMTIDTHVAMKVSKQCLYLAGPGVLINAGIAAFFLWAYPPLDWSFLLCLVTGAILCATDPVAVVALLKELGASPTLTVQIQGESLLNDGTAIVLFTVAYDILAGKSYDIADVVRFLVKTALYAWILGCCIGVFFYLWIKGVKNHFNHHSSMIQVSLTLACAYSSFLVAEGIFHISGVLATVSSSLVLAHFMWPEVNEETMHTVWHMFEYLGNTTIFFLAGALFGNAMVKIAWQDYLNLIIIYMALTVIRGALIILSRPLLQKLDADDRPVSVPDALVMTWGGLRGAVGLALAIHVSIDKAATPLGDAASSSEANISEMDANRVLFFVGGVAFLTLTINAITCPYLVNYLGITKTPEAKQELVMILYRQMVHTTVSAIEHPPPVRQCLDKMLDDIKHHLDPECTQQENENDLEPSPVSHHRSKSRLMGSSRVSARSSVVGLVSRFKPGACSDIHFDEEQIVKELDTLQNVLSQVPMELRRHLDTTLDACPPPPTDCAETSSDVAAVCQEDPDPELSRAVNDAFLQLVQSEYRRQLRDGVLSAAEARVLQDGLVRATSYNCYYLYDFHELSEYIGWNHNVLSSVHGEPSWESVLSALKDTGEDADEEQTWAQRLVETLTFQSAVMVTILANALFVFIEEQKRNTENSEDVVWLVLELLFTIAFTFEFVCKFAADARQYFFDGWNVFDFILVVLGWMGIIIGFAAIGDADVASQEAQTAKAVKVLKTLRAVRIIRLVRLGDQLSARLSGKHTEIKVAEHTERFNILCSFVKSHVAAQQDIIRYFGNRGKVDKPELAHCLLQSRVSVAKAKVAAAFHRTFLADWLLDEANLCQENLAVASKLEDFVKNARDSGILGASEAETMIHAMHHHMSKFSDRARDVRLGRAGKHDGPFISTNDSPTKIAEMADPELKVEKGGASCALHEPAKEPEPAEVASARRKPEGKTRQKKRVAKPAVACASSSLEDNTNDEGHQQEATGSKQMEDSGATVRQRKSSGCSGTSAHTSGAPPETGPNPDVIGNQGS